MLSILYPNVYFSSVKDITAEFLNKQNIKALILDVDNTLIDYYENLSEDIIKWAENLQKNGITLYILSNTNKEQKINKVARNLKIKYEKFAHKPAKGGYLKIMQKLKLNPEKIATVGDQIFTDVIGGNRCKMFTILVDPVAPKDFWYTAWKRPIENILKKKIVKGDVNVSK